MVDLNIDQERKLKELRDLYKYDKALAKQAGYTFESKQAELEVLAGLHLSRKIQTLVEEYVETVGLNDLTHLVLMGVVCNEALGKIAGYLDEEVGTEVVDQALHTVDQQRDKFRKIARAEVNNDDQDS
jgi:predicted metalloprotease with PDZ domain